MPCRVCDICDYCSRVWTSVLCAWAMSSAVECFAIQDGVSYLIACFGMLALPLQSSFPAVSCPPHRCREPLLSASQPCHNTKCTINSTHCQAHHDLNFISLKTLSGSSSMHQQLQDNNRFASSRMSLLRYALVQEWEFAKIERIPGYGSLAV